MSGRERQIVEAIARGNSCGGGYNCGPLNDDIAKAEEQLATYRVSVVSEATEAHERLRGAMDQQTADDLATLAEVGRMYLDALDNDPRHIQLSLAEALRVTYIRQAVERQEARSR